jgi:polyisoprenoid-binding protein YceI
VTVTAMKRLLLLLTTLLVSNTLFAADQHCVVPGRGYFRIHVGTAGLFGGLGHDHSIEAQKVMGCAMIDSNDVAHSSVKLEFSTAGIRVIDPKESEKDRAEVQKTMETQVLRVSEYPRVTFESTGIEQDGALNRLRVRGNLTIRGKTLPVVIPVMMTRLTDGTYRAAGEYKFRQSSFLIKPIQLAGGTVKVKDELQTEFEIFLR